MDEARDAKHHQSVLLNFISFVNPYKIMIPIVNLQYSKGKEQVNRTGWEAERDRKGGKAEGETKGILSLWGTEKDISWKGKEILSFFF